MQKYNIDCLEVRRSQQFLSLMYNRSKDVMKIVPINDDGQILTQSSDKVKFVSDFTSVTSANKPYIERLHFGTSYYVTFRKRTHKIISNVKNNLIHCKLTFMLLSSHLITIISIL